jgi:hypothetical protein
MNAPTLHWFLTHTEGLIPERSVVEELLDPCELRSLAEMDEEMNKISREGGWKVEVSSYSLDIFNPETATVVFSKGTTLMRRFVALNVSVFLAYHKSLGINGFHRRSTSLRIDYARCDVKTAEEKLKKYFGDFAEVEEGYRKNPTFWKHLVFLCNHLGDNLMMLHRSQFEKILSGDMTKVCPAIEALCNKHISELSPRELIDVIEKTHVVMRIIDGVERHREDGYEIVRLKHNYHNEHTIKHLEEHYVNLFKSAGIPVDSKITSSSIILKIPA